MMPMLRITPSPLKQMISVGLGGLLLAPLSLQPLVAQTLAPVPSGAACGGTKPQPQTAVPMSNADVQMLRSLLQRHNIAFPGLAELSNCSSRWEFAAVLNVALDHLNELLATQKITLSRAELATIKQLQQSYAQELATLRGRVEALEPRSGTLERQQFSTTTRLSGETIFADRSRARFAQGDSPTPMFSQDSRRERPGTGNTEGYNLITENSFQVPQNTPLSTFSIDVDTASYSNVRRFITQGQLPPKDAVRLEELINYFPYDYPLPSGDRPFSVTTDVAIAPWNPNHKLVQIGLKGKQLKTVQPSNLVFLVDVSGSMGSANKLPLVQQSLRLLVQELSDQDQVTLVAYAGKAGLVLPPTSARDKSKILAAINQLEAGGSTAGGEGIELAYKMAQQSFLAKGNNRVILATDGDFNVGVSSDAELVRLIEQKRDLGVFLTILGFGMGNYKDSKMEQLANKGNGNYAYIDSLMEAKKVLVHDLRGTLFTIAKDVKIQVEFNPRSVQAYRLIGYENRLLRDQDFNDDTKDAGEIGAGHTVTALYEIIPMGTTSPVKLPSVDPLKYQRSPTATLLSGDELMQVKLRYKPPTGSTSQLISQSIRDRQTTLETASANLKFSAAVAMYGMLLRNSENKGSASFELVLQLAGQAKGSDRFGYRSEFISLVEQSRSLMQAQQQVQPAPKSAKKPQ
jgi:Ca-activated chloride channel homolog